MTKASKPAKPSKPSKPADSAQAIDFALTERQIRTLRELAQSVPTPQSSQEDHSVKLQGYMQDGKLVIENLTVEYLHRWMDCADHPRPRKPIQSDDNTGG